MSFIAFIFLPFSIHLLTSFLLENEHSLLRDNGNGRALAISRLIICCYYEEQRAPFGFFFLSLFFFGTQKLPSLSHRLFERALRTAGGCSQDFSMS